MNITRYSSPQPKTKTYVIRGTVPSFQVFGIINPRSPSAQGSLNQFPEIKSAESEFTSPYKLPSDEHHHNSRRNIKSKTFSQPISELQGKILQPHYAPTPPIGSSKRITPTIDNLLQKNILIKEE